MHLDWKDLDELVQFINQNATEAMNDPAGHFPNHMVNALSNIQAAFETVKREVGHLEAAVSVLQGTQPKLGPQPPQMLSQPGQPKSVTLPPANDQLAELLFIARNYLDCAQKDYLSKEATTALKALTAKVEELES